MIRHNPYASSSKKRPPSRPNGGAAGPASQKRAQRPWETATTTNPQWQTSSSSLTTPRDTTKVSSSLSSSPSEFDNSFDDPDFDWGSALETINACEQAAMMSSNRNSQNSATTTTVVAAASPSSVSSSSKENKTNHTGSTTTHSRRQQHAPPNKPPIHSGNQRKTATTAGVPPNQETLVSLRPNTWLTASSSSSSNNDKRPKKPATPPVRQKQPPTPQRAPFGDERQIGLPQPLQFPPSRLLPVDDGDDDDYGEELFENAELSSPLLNGWTLFPHQVDAIQQALVQRRFILALDMGLGKTLIGAVWSKAFLRTEDLNCKNAFILCPVSLTLEWKRTAENCTGLCVKDPTSKSGAKKKKSRKKKAKKKVIELYSDEEEEEEERQPDYTVSIHSWAKVPQPPDEDNFIVVADEAHSIQNMQSNRTQSTLQLVSHERCIGVLLLTGTPMKNGKPSNLFPLLKAVQHPLGKHQRAFEAHFCEGREVRFGNARPVWQANGSANLDQLRQLTQSHMLHLTKEKCLKNLPPQTRVFEDVPVSSRKQLQHNEALKELAKVYTYSKNAGENDAILGGVTKVRMIGSLAKVDPTVQFAIKTLEEEPAVVIFTSFLEVASQVHRKLKESGWSGELLTGETPPKKRQGMVDTFQKGLSPVFVCTFGAGGVGLTLTAAHTIILLDRPWTPGDAHQAEDRVRRIGQTKPVKSVWMRAFEIDKQIDDMIAHKTETSSAVLTKDASGKKSSAGTSSQRISIAKLLEAVLPKNNTAAAATQGGTTSDGMTQTSILQFSQPTELIDD